MPTFSIVIPTYNRSMALRRTLESVLQQTYDDFEVIVVDDGSTDDTRTVVLDMADDRIRYAWIQNSGGPATPRNLGMSMATGEWLCFLDSDDLWFPEKLEVLGISISLDSEVDVIGNNEVVRYPDGHESVLRYGPTHPDFYRTLLVEGNRCSTSAMTVRRSFVESHGMQFNTNNDYVIVEDYDFWMHLAIHGARFRFLDVVLGEYVRSEGGISANEDRLRRNWLRLLEHHAFHVQQFEPDRKKLWRQLRARAYATNAVADLRQRKPISFCLNVGWAVSISPVTVARWLVTRIGRRFGKASND